MPVKQSPKQQLAQAIESHVPIEEAPVGIHFNVPFEKYCNIKAINNSKLSKAIDSLLHFKESQPSEDNDSFAFGSLCHTGRLEPKELENRYVVIPDSLAEGIMTKGGELAKAPKQTSEYKERLQKFLQQHPNKQEVSEDWMKRMRDIVQRIDDHPVAGKLFSKGVSEVTIIWEDKLTGLKCKGRLDWVAGPEVGMSLKEFIKATVAIVDLKTTDDVVNFSLDKWGYHRQSAFYLEGWKTLTKKILPFHFAAAEKDPPHAIRCAPVGQAALRDGLSEVRWLLDQVSKGYNNDMWPGPKDPKEWGVGQWYKPLQFTEHHH